ncbi:MAG: putative zinc-binding metallopeptidase [Planctomycetota bacterium]
MRTYSCTCGNQLFFDNRTCTACGLDCGWCEQCRSVCALEPVEEDASEGTRYTCGNDACGAVVAPCRNRIDWDACNAVTAGGGKCSSCELTERAPDLSDSSNLNRWREAEAAKRRLLYDLDLVSFAWKQSEPQLGFRFLVDTPDEHFPTGHDNGLITLNLKEADPVTRESEKQRFGESQRTLIGHLRHEISHYVWLVCVDGIRDEDFREVFGDERQPAYGEAMSTYYDQGPPADWSNRFISRYAAAHPWEDFAETAAFYLDMKSLKDTLIAQFGEQFVGEYDSLQDELSAMQTIGRKLNEVNRSLGLTDVVPEVIPPPVIDKLRFIDGLFAARL